ncbi:hypothetical protein SBF1_1810021 [Candidatus Desulfosporosinus infrequens]|uniref:Uncharacterized protein n=1 Tax=Candidatus Desulfosporosinus infrequens TaxID=2043169 RepID=A0A2U3KCR4_9FIRM|nr:hypothetical protein SBF1_1810021 [Candidatus Desulfosporosinus infrequens]
MLYLAMSKRSKIVKNSLTFIDLLTKREYNLIMKVNVSKISHTATKQKTVRQNK